MESNFSDEKIRARFVTSYEEYRVPDAPISIPSKLNRRGLTGVINHLLGRDDEKAFDFLIDGRILRQSIAKLLTQLRKSSENIIVIEYIPAVTLSDESEGNELPAWIGALDCSLSGSIIVTGCYDGHIHLINASDESVLSNTAGHDEPIRCIKVIPNVSQSSFNNDSNKYTSIYDNKLIVSGSKDQTVKLWKIQTSPTINKKQNKNKTSTNNTNSTITSLQHITTLSGHINSVECLEYIYNHNYIVSGDWSGNIFIWDLNSKNYQNILSNTHIDDDENVNNTSQKKYKKLKRNAMTHMSDDDDDMNIDISDNQDDRMTSASIKPLYTIHAHAQKISSICSIQSYHTYINTKDDVDVHSSNSTTNTIYTGSWDHTIKQYDLETQNCVQIYSTTRVITALDYSPINQLVLSSYTDGKIKLYDCRQKDNVMNLHTYGKENHTPWISQVKWQSSTSNNYLFASCDYDGVVSLWDTRSHLSLGTTSCHDGKALCIDWLHTTNTTTNDNNNNNNNNTSNISDNDDNSWKIISGGSDCYWKATSLE